MRKISIIMIWAAFFISPLANAQQVESPVMCDEGVIGEPIPIVYGDHTVNCVIDTTGDIDRFTFDGLTGDVVRIKINSGGNSMDPRLEIFDPMVMKIVDTSCNDSCVIVEELTLAKDGTYTVLISDLGVNNTGSYQMQITLLLPLARAVAPEEIFYDDPVTDDIDPAVDCDAFDFQGVAGDEIRFIVNSGGSGNFMDPRIEIWDPDGDKLEDVFCTDSCAYTRETSQFAISPTAALPKTGLYRVHVSDQGINNTGSYTINVQCLLGSCDPTPPVPLSAETRGTIESATDMDFYTYDADAGTQVRVLVNSGGSGNFMDPRIEIWDPDGVKLEDVFCTDSCAYRRETSDFAISPTAALPKTGVYRVLVSDQGVNNTGDYEISIHCLIGSCDTDQDGVDDPPRRPVLEYGVNGRVSSVIENVTDMDCYSFYGTSGDLIRHSVNSSGNFMDPHLEMWAPDGSKLTEGVFCNDSCAYTHEPSQYTLLPSATLPQTGNYELCMSDAGTNNTGTYFIELECLIGTCIDDPAAPPTTGDNCADVPNAPPLDCDTDADGFGNACDADFNQDGVVNGADFPLFIPDFETSVDSGIGSDMNCDGIVNGPDFTSPSPSLWLEPVFLNGFDLGEPGPGLSCVGSVPCP